VQSLSFDLFNWTDVVPEGTAPSVRWSFPTTLVNNSRGYQWYIIGGSTNTKTYSDVWSLDVGCQAGYYKNASGYCEPCTLGTYTSLAGQTKCLSCEPGYYTNLHGSTNCSWCPLGFYSSKEAASSCKACPPNSITTFYGATTLIDCVCVDGTFLINYH
jgi:hypothetical protein